MPKAQSEKAEARRQKESKAVMLKSKLIVVLSLLFVLTLDGDVLAGKTIHPPALNPDGIAAGLQQRHRRRRARRKQRSQKAGSYGIKSMPEQPPTPSAEPNTGAAPPPPPPPSPAAEEMPTKAAPPSPASPEMEAPVQSAPKKGAPRIKPPTVQIKPPTK